MEAAAHVVRVEAVLRAALGAGVAVHLLAGFLPDGVHLVHGLIDAGDVLGLVSGLQLGEGALDLRLLVDWEFVAVFLQLLLGLEDHAVSLIELVDALAFLLVGFGIGLGLVLHALDFGVGQT